MTKEEIEKKIKDLDAERLPLQRELNILRNEERRKAIDDKIIQKALNNEYVYLSKFGGDQEETILIGQLRLDAAKAVIFQGIQLSFTEEWDDDECDVYFDKIIPEIYINITFGIENEKYELIEPWNHVVSAFLEQQKDIQKILNSFNA